MYIKVLFSALDLASHADFLSLQLEIPSQVVQLIENLATACARRPEGSFGVQGQLSRIRCRLSFPSGGKRVHHQLPWTTGALGIIPREHLADR
jgi:hypothetical protein